MICNIRITQKSWKHISVQQCGWSDCFGVIVMLKMYIEGILLCQSNELEVSFS